MVSSTWGHLCEKEFRKEQGQLHGVPGEAEGARNTSGHLGEALGGVTEGRGACSSAPSVGGRDQRLERVIQEALEEKDSLSLDDSGSGQGHWDVNP